MVRSLIKTNQDKFFLTRYVEREVMTDSLPAGSNEYSLPLQHNFIFSVYNNFRDEDIGYDERPNIVAAKFMMIRRCHKLPILTINGVLPT